MTLAFGRQGIAASSGYPQYTGTALLPPTVSMNILERYYAQSIFPEIANTDFAGELKSSGGTVHFLREPEPIIRPYVKNQRIIYDTAEIQSVPLTVGHAFHAGYKIDKIDFKMMSMWPKIEAMLTKKIPLAMMREIDYTIFAGLVNEIHAQNKGTQAGPHGTINLGDYGNPVVLDKDNVVEFIFRLTEVLQYAGIPREGRFIVVPPRIATLIKLSSLGCADCAGTGTSMRITGEIPTNIDGLRIIESAYLPSYDDGGRKTFHIYAGTKQALTFASIIDDAEVIENDAFEYTRFLRVIGAYGFGVLYPEALAAGYVTVQ